MKIRSSWSEKVGNGLLALREYEIHNEPVVDTTMKESIPRKQPIVANQGPKEDQEDEIKGTKGKSTDGTSEKLKNYLLY